MDDILKSPFFYDRWQMPFHELFAWLVFLLIFCALSVWPHLQRNVSSATVTVARGSQLPPVSTGSTGTTSWRLDLNSATLAELECLPGIGPRRAESIIRERTKRGEFRNLWDLCEIPGLTRGRVQRLEPLVLTKKNAQPTSVTLPLEKQELPKH